MGSEKNACASEGRVHLKMVVGGVEVEVECEVSEVEEVVARILRGVGDRAVASGADTIGRSETCKGLLLRLWDEGWFGVGRSLGEVCGELGRRGFHYDRTAVAHALVDLVRESVLSRLGRARRYRYVQKRPPSGSGEVDKGSEKK